jgi:hypothetical protein
MKARRWAVAAAVLAAAAVSAGSAGASVDPGTRTVQSGPLTVQWSATNPEEILSISYNGSPNLTNSWPLFFCDRGDSEFFGNSWDNDLGPNGFAVPVGWGTTGTWSGSGLDGVRIDSAATGCFATSGIPVQTSYRFFANTAGVGRMLVRRRFTFGSTPFVHNFRAYIPRLYPRDEFTDVIHPNAGGSALVTENAADCELGCALTDWNGSWLAIHAPSSGRGLIVRHELSSTPVALWVDLDGGSATTASSVLLLHPPGGFTGTLNEVESLCFYDSTSWTPTLSLPNGC